MAKGDAPDYWLRGQVIELIKTLELIKRIELIDLIEVIDRINRISSIIDVPFAINPIRNASFESGDLSGWYWGGVKAEVVKPAFEGDFCCKLDPGTILSQLLPPHSSLNAKLNFIGKADVEGDRVNCFLEFTDATSEGYLKTLTVDWGFYSQAYRSKKILRRIFFLAPAANVGDIYLDFITLIFPGLSFEGPDVETASGSILAAENTAGLQVSLNNDYRQLVQFRATLGAAGEIRLEASHNGADWFLLWSKTLDEADSYCDWDFCAFPYFRVNVPTTGIDIAIDLRAVRL